MILHRGERTCLFIDGANHYAACRRLDLHFDFEALLAHVRGECRLVRAYYYSALLDTDDHNPVKPLTDWLSYNGFTVVTKLAREFTDPVSGQRRAKGNMDIELAIDMLELAPAIDHAVLFSGDADFRRLVEAVQRRGVRVTVVSTVRSAPPVAGDELRRQCDGFVELAEFGQRFNRRRPVPESYPPDDDGMA